MLTTTMRVGMCGHQQMQVPNSIAHCSTKMQLNLSQHCKTKIQCIDKSLTHAFTSSHTGCLKQLCAFSSG